MMSKLRHLLSLLVLASLTLFLTTPAAAQAPSIIQDVNQAMVITQIRGSEACCDPGKIEHLVRYIDTTQQHSIPLYVALRYDALKDPAYQELVTQEGLEHVTVGAFLEITPSLAEAAGVKYAGSEANWFSAEHAYPVGYSQQDREQLIDTYMEAYEEVFGEYPLFTVGWILDSYSIGYVRSNYNVVMHQITREQWGTDSYTLYGGPPHYPYLASRNWAFMPDSTGVDTVVVVRQTLTDPVHNYGDTSAGYTSQPNDFARTGKPFSYFEDLVTQAFNQADDHPGFVLLGIENSMADEYQDLFLQQLAYLSQQEQVTYPTPLDVHSFWGQRKITLYGGQTLADDTDHTGNAWWITTDRYRMRIRQIGSKVFITDWRIYHTDFKDPYFDHRAQHRGFWVAPFIIDGSRIFGKQQSWLERLWAYNEFPFGLHAKPDSLKSQRILLPSLPKGETLQWKREGDRITLSYPGAPRHIIFEPQQITTEHLTFDSFKAAIPWGEDTVIAHKRRQLTSVDESVGAQWECEGPTCTVTFDVHPELFEPRSEPLWLFPERQAAELGAETLVFAHNPIARLDRNPVRLVVIPITKDGVPAQLEEPLVISFNKKFVHVETDVHTAKDDVVQFYDITAEKPTQTKVSVSYKGEEIGTANISFVPNCSAKLGYCITHPSSLVSFVQLKWREIIVPKLVR